METLRHPILAKTNHCMFSNILNFLCVAFGFIWVFPYSKLRYGLLRVHSLRAPSHSTLKKKRRKGRKKEKEKGRKKKEMRITKEKANGLTTPESKVCHKHRKRTVPISKQ